MTESSNGDPLVFATTRTPRTRIREVLIKGPRNDKGDPWFTSLEQMGTFLNEEDVVYLVNKALYSLDYQASFHRKRNEEFKLLRQLRKAQAEVGTTSTASSINTPASDAPAPEAPTKIERKVLSTKNNLREALARLRQENDEDLGPSGEFTVEAVPPGTVLSPEDEQRLSDAFAKLPQKE